MADTHVPKNHFERALNRAVRADQCVAVLGWLFTLAGILGVAMLGLLLLDSVLHLSAWARIILATATTGIGTAAGWLGAIRISKRPHRFRRCVALERVGGLTHNELVNAAGLFGKGKSRLNKLLVSRVVRQGELSIAGLKRTAGLDIEPVRWGVAWLLAGLIGWGLCVLWSPHVVHGALARWYEPFSDHPPYSLTYIEVSFEPQSVQAGQDIVVRAKVSGGIEIQTAKWVKHSGLSSESEQWAMTRVGDGEFVRRLVDIRQPITFYVTAGGGRSRRCRIEPIDSEPKAVVAAGKQLPGSNPTAFEAETHESLRVQELVEVLQDLLNQSRLLMEEGVDGDAQWKQAAEALLLRGASVAGQWEEQAGSATSSPYNDWEDRRTPSASRGGQGGHGAFEGETISERLRRFADWAERELARLDDRSGLRTHGVLTKVGGAPGQTNGRDVEPAVGRSVEVAVHQGAHTDGGRAVAERVPEAYREVAARYLWMITRDQDGQRDKE